MVTEIQGSNGFSSTLGAAKDQIKKNIIITDGDSPSYNANFHS